MAKSVSKSGTSLIATLAAARAKIFRAANSTDHGVLSDEQADEVDALNYVIATSTPSNPADAATQLSIALDLVELCRDSEQPESALEAAYAALRAAIPVLCPRLQRAA